MKKLIFTILGVLVLQVAIAQAPAIQWQKSFGASSNNLGAESIQQTTDGGYIMVGIFGSTAIGSQYIAKIDAIGNLQWTANLNKAFSFHNDTAYCVQQTTDGGYIVAGYSNSTAYNGNASGNHGGYDYWIVKLSSSGSLVWQKCFGGSNDDEAYFIQQTTDGGYIIAGKSNSIDGDVTNHHINFSNNNYDYWIVKIDNVGNLQWQKSLGGKMDDNAYSIQQTTDGGYIIAGDSASTDGDVTGTLGQNNYWIVKLDAIGNLQWQKSLGGNYYDYAYSIRQTTDGGYVVAGSTRLGSGASTGDVIGNHGFDDYWIVKLNSSGNIIWQKALGGSGIDNAFSIQQTTDGGYIVAGESQSTDGDVIGNHGWDYWIVKLNSSGNVIWKKALGGSGLERAKSIQQTTDGGYVVAGDSGSPNDGDVTGNNGRADIWVVKLGPDILARSTFNKESFKLYPVPVKDILNIGLANVKNVVLTDIDGKVVLTQNNTIQINMQALERGVYFVTVTNENDEKATQKVMKE